MSELQTQCHLFFFNDNSFVLSMKRVPYSLSFFIIYVEPLLQTINRFDEALFDLINFLIFIKLVLDKNLG